MFTHPLPYPLAATVRTHLERSFADLGSSNKIDLQVEARGNWWEVRQGSPWLAKAETAIYKEWGVQPLYVREGGFIYHHKPPTAAR